MKNVHLIPTDKPSRLHYFAANKEGYYLYPNNELVVPRNPNCINQNIYITSDEEIKEGDWIFDIVTKKIEIAKFNHNDLKRDWKKIILTTDPRLAPDVQKIDDEFLEWFVKNPSCERVETKRIGFYKPVKNEETDIPEFDSYDYGIIIPKKEPKHPKVFSENGDELFFDEQGNLIKEEPKQVCENCKIEISKWGCGCGLQKKPKQETLEEAAERLIFKTIGGNYGIMSSDENDQVDGYYNTYEEAYLTLKLKWQQERSYSEEDMKDYALKCISNYLFGEDFISYNLKIPIVENNNKQFEKFKNK